MLLNSTLIMLMLSLLLYQHVMSPTGLCTTDWFDLKTGGVDVINPLNITARKASSIPDQVGMFKPFHFVSSISSHDCFL